MARTGQGVDYASIPIATALGDGLMSAQQAADLAAAVEADLAGFTEVAALDLPTNFPLIGTTNISLADDVALDVNNRFVGAAVLAKGLWLVTAQATVTPDSDASDTARVRLLVPGPASTTRASLEAVLHKDGPIVPLVLPPVVVDVNDNTVSEFYGGKELVACYAILVSGSKWTLKGREVTDSARPASFFRVVLLRPEV